MRKAPRQIMRRLSPAGERHAGRYQLSKTEQRFVRKIMELLVATPPSAPN